MTKAERTIKMAALRTDLDALVVKYNEEEKVAERDKLDEDIKALVNEYTAHCRAICFEECLEAPDPMIEAVTRLTYETIAVKDETDEGNTGVKTRVVVKADKAIDLMKLHQKSPNGIGHDKNWAHVAQKMNYLMTVQVCKDLNVDVKELATNYEMSEIAKSIEMGNNPTSNTNLLKTLQQVITAMLGEDYKALTWDVNYLKRIYSKKGKKALSVSVANHANFRKYIAEICHRIVTGGVYTVDYKIKSAK
jgi:hypothetical protein